MGNPIIEKSAPTGGAKTKRELMWEKRMAQRNGVNPPQNHQDGGSFLN
jgi:hypothetical protein